MTHEMSDPKKADIQTELETSTMNALEAYHAHQRGEEVEEQA